MIKLKSVQSGLISIEDLVPGDIAKVIVSTDDYLGAIVVCVHNNESHKDEVYSLVPANGSEYCGPWVKYKGVKVEKIVGKITLDIS